MTQTKAKRLLMNSTLMKASAVVLVAALGLAACGKGAKSASEPTQLAGAASDQKADGKSDKAEALKGPPAVEGKIDWQAARDAKMKQTITDTPITVQSADGKNEPPKVPVLLPSGIVQTASAKPPALVATKDGYFATYHLPKYDAIVNGSNKGYSAGGKAGDKEAMKFTTGEASAQLSFSRFGADYLIEFECREVDGSNSCINEDQAKEFADSLFVQNTQ